MTATPTATPTAPAFLTGNLYGSRGTATSASERNTISSLINQGALKIRITASGGVVTYATINLADLSWQAAVTRSTRYRAVVEFSNNAQNVLAVASLPVTFQNVIVPDTLSSNKYAYIQGGINWSLRSVSSNESSTVGSGSQTSDGKKPVRAVPTKTPKNPPKKNRTSKSSSSIRGDS